MSGCEVLLIVILLLIIAVVYYFLSLPSVFAQRLNVTCQRLISIAYPPTPALIDVTSPASLQFLLDLSLKVSQSNCPQYPFVPPSGFTVVRQLGTPMYGYVLESADTYLVVFTGTMLLSEWIDDFRFFQRPWPADPHLLVHGGFLRIYQSVQAELGASLRGSKPVIVTGHSLGGALSTLASFDLAGRGRAVRQVSFASPRVGNNAFAEAFNATVEGHRYFNTEDLVVALPPPVLGSLIYTHVRVDEPFTRNLGSYVRNHVRAYVENFSD